MSAAFPEIEGTRFDPDGGEEPAALAAVDAPADASDAGLELVEWTPDRAAAIVRGLGFVLHSLDGAASLDGGEELWRATEQEAADIGAPLARLLARYEPSRRLAGHVDEAEGAAALWGYTKRNLALRGRLILADSDGNPQPVVEPMSFERPDS